MNLKWRKNSTSVRKHLVPVRGIKMQVFWWLLDVIQQGNHSISCNKILHVNKFSMFNDPTILVHVQIIYRFQTIEYYKYLTPKESAWADAYPPAHWWRYGWKSSKESQSHLCFQVRIFGDHWAEFNSINICLWQKMSSQNFVNKPYFWVKDYW